MTAGGHTGARDMGARDMGARGMEGRGRLRVFNLGLPKSGTTTLGVALGHAGLKVADWRIRKGQTEDRRILYGFVGDHMYRGYYGSGDPWDYLAEFDAVTEASVASKGLSLWPQTDWGLIAALRARHPGMKFLLSHRDPAALAQSMLGWSNLGRSRLPGQNVPGMPAGYGTSADQLIRWIEGHYAFCRQVFRDDPDFLEYDILDPEAPARIGAFLGLELPWWGRANAKDRDEEDEAPPAGAAATPAAGSTPAAPAIAPGAAAHAADPARRIYLHGGAHRTGSSSLQLCLSVNRAALEGAGYSLAYSARDGAPDGRLRLKLPEPRHNPRQAAALSERAAQEIARHFTVSNRLILSEENLPGRMMHFYSGQFFPAAEARAIALRAALGKPPEHLLFVLRDYESFFISAHRKRAVQRSVHDFADLRAQVMQMDRGWPELLRILRDHLRPQAMTVLDYRLRGQSRDLLARLVPDLAAADLAEPDRVVNLSATDAALEAIQARFAAGEKPTPAQIEALIAEHAGDRRDLGFAAFSEPERKVLADRYAADLDRIGQIPDIALIRP